MTDMFAGMEDSLSPKEKWVKENGVGTLETEDDHGPKWVVSSNGVAAVSRESRDDALKQLAQRLWVRRQIKPWGMS